MKMLWRILDPMLLLLRSRLEHLEDSFPSPRHEREMRAQARISPSAQVFNATMLATGGRPEQIVIGDHACIMGEVLVMTPTAHISIGHHSFLGRNSRVWASLSVTVGNHVLISHLVDIIDNNSHSLNYRDRRVDAINLFENKVPTDMTRVMAAPVVIHDDVWIGAKSTILKGVTIGQGAVIAAGSVVTRDVAEFTLVAGNPARAVKELPRE